MSVGTSLRSSHSRPQRTEKTRIPYKMQRFLVCRFFTRLPLKQSYIEVYAFTSANIRFTFLIKFLRGYGRFSTYRKKVSAVFLTSKKANCVNCTKKMPAAVVCRQGFVENFLKLSTGKRFKIGEKSSYTQSYSHFPQKYYPDCPDLHNAEKKQMFCGNLIKLEKT